MPATPPRNGPKDEWTTPTRVRILTLLDMGVSQAEASCQTGVPRPTVNLWSKTHYSLHNYTCSGCLLENVWKMLKTENQSMSSVSRNNREYDKGN
ncbi:hypothetical protein L873DRAFT_1813030 [Choiromyces venosus 120613-1]|uniref:HTH psq-type domain-containing protein n=1 Tax=Choiromyces venosus 120613-1 TaxID=1336337 RepID=A0A3N4JAN4_9PEZI|nr:hypothetical protein L873DRAFT_1813030 [Choiromyces venosus 120613-1]